VIFVRVASVILWCGGMTIMELSGSFASSVIGGLSVTPDRIRT